ncbi:MAG: hypothetical protein SGPRY_005857 [Prymnesium sp.]
MLAEPRKSDAFIQRDNAASDEHPPIRAVVRVGPLARSASGIDARRDLKANNSVVMSGGVSRELPIPPICQASLHSFTRPHVEGIPLVRSVLSGYNSALISYGQTGTGKTHTIAGGEGDEGLMTRMLHKLFEDVQISTGFHYDVYLQYFQIYHEEIFDLLTSDGSAADASPHVREGPDGVSVEGAKRIQLNCAAVHHHACHFPLLIKCALFGSTPPLRPALPSQDGMHALAHGHVNQKVAQNAMGRSASRAHTIALLTVERQSLNEEHPSPSGVQTAAWTVENADVRRAKQLEQIEGVLDSAASCAALRATLTIADLAGSERSARSGQPTKESAQLNASLHAFDLVVNQLAQSQTLTRSTKKIPTPYKNSTLTKLLQEALGGNCRTCLIVCCSPLRSEIAETKASLVIGQRAMLVKNSLRQNAPVDHRKVAARVQQVVGSSEEACEQAHKKAQLFAVRAIMLVEKLRRAAPSSHKSAAPSAETLPHTEPAIAGLEAEVTKLRAIASHDAREKAAIVRQLEQAKEQHDERSAQLASVSRKFEELEGQRQAALAEVGGLKQELERQRRAEGRVEAERDAARAEVEILKSSQAAMGSRDDAEAASKWQWEVEKARQTAARLEKQASEERKRADTLQHTLHSLSKSLQAKVASSPEWNGGKAPSEKALEKELALARSEAESAKSAAAAFKRQALAERANGAALLHMTWRGVLLMLLMCTTAIFGLFHFVSGEHCFGGEADRPSQQACFASLDDVCPGETIHSQTNSPALSSAYNLSLIPRPADWCKLHKPWRR